MNPNGRVLKSVVASLFLVTIIAHSTGCASIICGSTQLVQFTSTPDTAKLEIVAKDGEVIHRVSTPTSISLKRGRGYFLGAGLRVRASADGYPAKEMPISSRLNPWYIGNILFGGLIGFLIVDPLTGAMFSFPEEIHINMNAHDGDTTSFAVPRARVIPDCYARFVRAHVT